MTWKSLSLALLWTLLSMTTQRALSQVTVDFSADVVSGCSSVQAQFQDLSSSSAGTIVSWDWDLSGVQSSLSSPGRIFAGVGSYEVCLTVEDDQGNVGTLCKQEYINVYDLPVADFDVDVKNGCAPLNVTYEDLSSSPNGEISEWTWGLNGSNGIIETNDAGRLIYSVYSDPDIYTISLSVTDDKGCSSAITKPNLVEAFPSPIIEISTIEPIGCSFPMTVDFVNDGPVEDLTYFWDFGNGETYEGYDPGPTSFPVEAAYDIEIIAANNVSGCTDTLRLTDYINSGGTILFDFYPKRVCANGSVQFEDLSPIEAETWEWDFGDGSTSVARDPSHIYKQPGTYTVSLSRRTAECEGIQVSQYNVTVEERPELDFSIEKEHSCILPARVRFTEHSGEEGRYAWYIGKPGEYTTTLHDRDMEYEFTEYGSYEVRLLKENDIGCRTVELVDTILIEPLEIQLTGQPEGCIPFIADLGFTSNSISPISEVEWLISGDLTLQSNESSISVEVDEVSNYQFQLAVRNEVGCVDTIQGNDILRGGVKPEVDFSISDDEVCPKEVISFTDESSGNVNEWTWTFNDSSFHYTQNPELPFNAPGPYKVSLEVGHNGCYSTVTRDSLFVVNFPGVAFELEYNCEDPYRVKALNTSSDFDSLIWSYSFAGDTTYLPLADSVEIDFPDNNEYIISLEAYNFDNGCDNYVSDTVWISDLQANFEVDVTEGCAPLIMEFTDESQDAISWQYFTEISRFNDDTLPDPTLRINPPGAYTDIGLVVSGRHGCTDTSYVETIRVNAVEAAFLTPDPVCISDTIHIENTASSMFSEIVEYKWILGDNIDTNYTSTASFVMDEIGKHDVKLVVKDDWGCADSLTTGLAAFFRAPNFELAADSLSCTTHALDFRNKLHATTYNYQWTFGDGDSSVLANPTHLYEDEGDYPVTVRIEDTDGCVNHIDDVILARIADPIASFTADSTFTACPPLVTTFTNNSTNSISYLWNFGDESGQSSAADPAHLYIKAGVFDVGLIAVRTPHCKDTMLLEELIQLDGPKGEFEFDVDSSCVPLFVSFTATLAEDYTLVWDFGDGNLKPIDEKTSFSQVEYTYEDAGNFVPKIILEDKENCKITREGENIETHALEAGFTSLDSVFCNNVPGEVVITDASYSTSPITSQDWIIDGIAMQGQEVSFSAVDTGLYDVTLVVGNAYCSDTISKSSFIRIGEAPVLLPQGDTFNCIGTEIQLSAESLDANDRITWLDSSGSTVSENPAYSIDDIPESTYFIIQAENEYQCIATDTVILEVINDQTAFAGPDKTICHGDMVRIVIEYGEEIIWPSIEGCRNCPSVDLSPDSMTYYPVQIINEYGCTVKDTLMVDVLYQEDIEAGDDQNICTSQKTFLLAFAEGDIQWSPAHLVDEATATLTYANISESTLFYLESTVDQCTLRDSVMVTVIEKANLETVGDTVCYGDMAHIYATGDIDNVRWETDGAELSNTAVMNPTSSTTVTTEFMAIGSLEGCEPDTSYAMVVVHPEIRGHLPRERNYFRGEDEVEVSLMMSTGGDYAFTWTPSEIVDCASCQTVMVETTDSAQFVHVEILERTTGCSDTLSVRLRQFYGCASASSSIGVPNIFSPNNDGVNDLLTVESPAFEDVNSIAIFNRWGEQVFGATSIQDSWDGTHNNEPVSSGVYTYLIAATCPDSGEVVHAYGDVTVIR